jgi:hypothetical protein
MDATHVCHERIQFRLRQLHLAQKLHTSARSYNIVTNHRRRILSTKTGELGQPEQRDLNRLPPAITHLHNPALSCNYDSSAMGHGEDFYDERRVRQLHFEPPHLRVSQVIAQSDGAMMVRSLTMEQFRKRLVKHFNIAFACREIVWPSRTGVPAPITE